MKYQIIYADPPWKYDFSNTKNREIENHYPTMELADIKKLPIELYCESDCVLYLWATAPKLLQAFEVLNAWGFEYKTQAVWDKQIIGMGYWFRGQHEILLVGTKGKFSPPRPELRKSSLYSEKRTLHSSKPKYFRDLIEKSFPLEFKKLELFAREKTEGWHAWGNEVVSDISL